MPPPVFDNFGRVIQSQSPDLWPARSGMALLLRSISPLVTSDMVGDLIRFYVPKALHDRNSEVAVSMREAAVALVDHHGKVS